MIPNQRGFGNLKSSLVRRCFRTSLFSAVAEEENGFAREKGILSCDGRMRKGAEKSEFKDSKNMEKEDRMLLANIEDKIRQSEDRYMITFSSFWI